MLSVVEGSSGGEEKKKGEGQVAATRAPKRRVDKLEEKEKRLCARTPTPIAGHGGSGGHRVDVAFLQWRAKGGLGVLLAGTAAARDLLDPCMRWQKGWVGC